MRKQFSKDKNINFHRIKKEIFFVKHTARDVEYTIKDFIKKNKDEVSNGILKAINTCKNSIVKIYHNCIDEGEFEIPDLDE